MGRTDLITTTFGKALGGASGGCIAGPKEIIEWMRNKGRPYLFSNTVPPAVVGATIKAIDLLSASTELRDKLEAVSADPGIVETVRGYGYRIRD